LDGPEDIELPDRCLKLEGAGPPITPTVYNNFVRIEQSRDYIVVLHEMGHEARTIPLDGRPHAPSGIRLWNGDSRGHWEGDTLVVETTNFNDRSSYPGGGFDPTNRTTEKMRLIERFYRQDDNTLLYQFTVDDPGIYSKPWRVEIPAQKSEGPLLEYACQEGNYANLHTIFAGARLDEEKAAKSRGN
jgi:hypothetical protein